MSERGPYNAQLTENLQFTKTNRLEVYPEIDPSSPSNSHAGKVIIITGASQGLGRDGIAWAFAQTNPKGLVLAARNAKGLEETAAEVHKVNPRIRVVTVPTDISDEDSVRSLFEKISETFGRADVLVNNSGVSASPAAIRDADPKTWWSDFQVNGYGTFLVTREFLRLVGTEQPASIVTVASHSSFLDLPTISAYLFSKLIGLQLSHFVAIENPNVTSISVHPGVIKTPMIYEGNFFEPYSGDSVTLAGATIAYLATEAAKWLNGRYCLASWDQVELKARKEDILKNNELVMGLQGKLGAEHWA